MKSVEHCSGKITHLQRVDGGNRRTVRMREEKSSAEGGGERKAISCQILKGYDNIGAFRAS